MFSIEDDDPWSVNKDVFDLICNFIQRSASLSITDVASRLNALYPDSRVQGNKKESAESFLLEMWDVVINVAVQLEPCSAEQNKLALLMNTLRDIETEQTLHIWGSPIILWKDLPLLGPVMTERLNKFPGNALFSDDKVWTKDRLQIQSFNAFAALLTKDGFDCSSHACMFLSSALEYPLTPEFPTGGELELKSRHPSGFAFKAAMTAAESWISQCCEVIYERSKQENGSGSTRGPLWHGKEGFSLERYQLLKQRLSDLVKDDSVEKSIRTLAVRAEMKMRNLKT